MIRPLLLALVCGVLGLPPLCAAPSAVKLVEQEDRLRVELDGELFTEYRFEEERFFPAFYPVLGPGQVPMTRRYPFEEVEDEDTDHPHHQSLWFAHCKVNGHNFWAVRPNKEGRAPGRTVHKGFKSIESGEKEGGFVSENEYVAADGTVILTDTRTLRFSAPQGAKGPRLIDFGIVFHASHGPITFEDDKDAGMAIRVAYELQVEKRAKSGTPVTGHLLNSEGITDKDTWGKRARWVDAYGTVGGRPVGVAILDHPTNPRHPTYWHSRTYGLVTANIFGKSHFESLDDKTAGEYVVPAGESLGFRWRFAFHEGGPESADVEGLFRAFAAE